MIGKSCVVLGANGFIGTNLIQGLLDAGANVKGFGRQDPGPHTSTIPWISGDFRDTDALSRAVKGSEVVYHLISDSTPAVLNTNNPHILMSDVCSTLTLLETCRREGVCKVVFISSGGTVYGIADASPISETSSTNPICSYGINKLTIEKYLHLYHHLYGLNYCIARLSNPFGPHQNTNKSQGIIATLISNCLKNQTTEIWGDGEIVRDYIYIKDVVDALLKLTDYSGDKKIFNVGSGVGCSINKIISDLEPIVGKEKIKIVYKDNFRPVDVPVNILNTDLIKSQIDWDTEVQWLEGLKLTVDWFSSQMKIA